MAAGGYLNHRGSENLRFYETRSNLEDENSVLNVVFNFKFVPSPMFLSKYYCAVL